jgi:cytochrome c oxidase subunit 2
MKCANRLITTSLLLAVMFCSASALAASSTQPYADTQSALAPAGANAGDVEVLWWRTFWLLLIVYVLVVLFTLIPAWLRRHRTTIPEPIMPAPQRERRHIIAVSVAVGITVIILFVILIGDFLVGNKARALGREPNQINIRLTGHQWWWEVTYMDVTPSKIVTDANEIHVPVGETVRLQLQSGDVIHSFWAPNISGKKDLIPGHPTTLSIRADREGTYWGQCAEFCGYQHAKMRFALIVQNRHDYDAWLEAARQPAREPTTDMQKKGMNVFLGRTCVMCHAIQGTPAGSNLGPNLTHVASRATIAAGSLPNSMGHLGGWVVDPQGIKPGVIMPQQNLSADDLQAVLEYLESLK